MAVSMSSRPSGSLEAAPPSVILRRSPRFDPYKASTAQRAEQRATPRSLKGTVDPSTFAVVPPVLVPKKNRKTSTTTTTNPTTATTSADLAPRTHKVTTGASSSLKENEVNAARQSATSSVKPTHLALTKRMLEETDAAAGISPIKTRSTRRSVAVVNEGQIESAPALRRLLKRKSKPATAENEVLPRAIIKSVKAKKHPCATKEKVADAEESTTVNGRSLRPRHRVAGSVIAQTCRTTAASLYKSIVTTILPNPASKVRKCRKTDVVVPSSPSESTTPEAPALVASSYSSAPIATSNDSVTKSRSITDCSPAVPPDASSNPSSSVYTTTHTPATTIPCTAPTPVSSTSGITLDIQHTHTPALSYSDIPEAPLPTPLIDSHAVSRSGGSETLSPYQDVVAIPTSPVSSYPAPSTYDTVDMGSMPVSDVQSPVNDHAGDFKPTGGFIESTYSTLAFALTPVPHPGFASSSSSSSSAQTTDATSSDDVRTNPAFASSVPYILPPPQFDQASIDSYTSYSPVSSTGGLVPAISSSFPSSSPSAIVSDSIGCHQLNAEVSASAQPAGFLAHDTTPGVGFVALVGESSNSISNGELMQGIQASHVPHLQAQTPERIGHSAVLYSEDMCVDETSQRTEDSKDVDMDEDMDVSMESAHDVPASESDLGFGFVPQEQVQTIQLPEASFVIPAPATEEYVAPTFWPRHAKLTVEWNVFSKSQRWHEYLTQIHAQLLAVPNQGQRKEGNLKRLCVVPDLKPMHEVGHQLNDRSLFVSMSRGRVLEICRRMGADTIRDIVADEAWRFFKKTGVFPTNFARTCMRNPQPAQPQPQPQRQTPQPDAAPVQIVHIPEVDSNSEEDVEEGIIDFMSEEIYDFELEDEDAMDEDAIEDVRSDPRLPARFRIYFPEEDDEPTEAADISNYVQDDDETEDDSSCSDDSDDDDDMELIASTDIAEPAPDGAGGCSFIQLDLQLPAQEPTSPSSLAPHEDLFHIPITHQVNFDQSAWEDARQLHGILQNAQDASRRGLTNPLPPRPINVETLKIPLNIPSFASIRLRCLTASDSFSYGQLPLRGTKADKVISSAWHLSPPPVATTDFAEHHARTGSVAVRPPRVYRHAIIKPPEVIKSFLKVAFAEVSHLSQNRKRVREQQDQDVDELERSRPRLRLDSGVTDQQVSSPSTSTCVSPIQGSAMAWMSAADAQSQQGMDASFQAGLQYQGAVLEAAFTQVTDMFQQNGVWYYGMPSTTGNDFPPVHHAQPHMYAPSSSSSLSNALG